MKMCLGGLVMYRRNIFYSQKQRGENILFGNREATEEELEKAIEITAFKKT